MKTVKVPMESLIQVILLQLETAKKANLTVTGFSMRPMLRQYRDSVVLAPINGGLQTGDIALYLRDNGSYVLHRVIRLTAEGYLFCGDNQAELESVRQDQLIAVVTGYTKNGQYRQLDGIGYGLYRFIMVRLFFMRKYYIWVRRGVGRLCSRIKRRYEK